MGRYSAVMEMVSVRYMNITLSRAFFLRDWGGGVTILALVAWVEPTQEVCIGYPACCSPLDLLE